MNLVNIIENGSRMAMSSKTGKTGSFARAFAFADRQTRMEHSHKIYATWLANGQYRPLANDVVDTLVPKAAQAFVAGLVPQSGAISKDQLIALCLAVNNAVVTKGKELKGEKAFVYGIVQRIAEQGAPEVIEA
jgi:hypothetical protein